MNKNIESEARAVTRWPNNNHSLKAVLKQKVFKWRINELYSEQARMSAEREFQIVGGQGHMVTKCKNIFQAIKQLA